MFYFIFFLKETSQKGFDSSSNIDWLKNADKGRHKNWYFNMNFV